MHRLLQRQLRELGLDSLVPPDLQRWEALLQRISEAYRRAEGDRDLLERALKVSSDEMQAMFQRQNAGAEGRLQALINALPDLVFMIDEDGRFVEVIAGDEDRLSQPAQKMKGGLVAELMPPELAVFFARAIAEALRKNALHVVEYGLEVPLGERAFEGRIVPTGLNVDGRRTVLFLARDVTELVRSRDQLNHVATHDGLTGLPNRALLKERLIQAVSRAGRLGSHGALIVLDIDRFKQVNDSLGHLVGDRLLKQVARRLLKASRTEDTVARFGGDEFVLILEDLREPVQAGSIARHILEGFSKPVQLAGFELAITASIGISVFPGDGSDSDSLLQQADSAMYAAKEAGRNNFTFYTRELGSNAMAYLALQSRLRRAISDNELALVYQPQFRLSDGVLVGLEALVRWPGADPEFRSPARFIPVAEMSGLIEPLGLWVLEETCDQIVSWRSAGLAFGRVAVNLSSRQLNNPQLAEQVRDILGRHGVPGSVLEFEITESMVVQEGGIPHQNIEAFGSMGIELALDDFGTGHSSLVNLKRFPLSRLKIDRSFVDGLGEDPNDEAIAGASIALARQLGLEVVAEGVETEAQVEFLRRNKCAVVQGFLFARPMPAAEISALYTTRAAAPGDWTTPWRISQQLTLTG